MPDENKKFPKVTTGAFIFNDAGKVFLMRSPKFNNWFIIPGGHVEWGEGVVDGLKREVKEETNLDIYDIKFQRYAEFTFDENFYADKHFISINFIAKTKNTESDVVLEGREASECVWLFPEEALKRDDVEPKTKEGIKIYLESIESEDYKASWQRALADYANLQKEVASRRQEWVQMSEQQILEEFLPIYSNFKKAFSVSVELDNTNATSTSLGATNNANAKWREGIGYIMKQFGQILKDHNVEEIKTVDEKFDPKFHEAAGEEEAEGEKHGKIVREVDGGYTMGGRVIKVAKVIISK